MCWQSTILNKQIAKEDIPVKKICEIYYPFGVLHSRDEIFYKSPCHSFVYSFSPAEKVNLIVNTHKGSKEFLSGKTYYTIEAGYHCYNPEINMLFKREPSGYEGYELLTIIYNGIEIGKYVGRSLVYVDMLIPKGSEYYENEQGEIVSNKLIILQEREFDV